MKKIRHTEEEMKTLYANWQQSGMNKKAYCQQTGIPHATFFYWIKKLSAKESSSATGFMELDLAPHFSGSENVFLEIEYPSGARVKLYRQAEASWIKSLL
jgi:transposase-like protein